MAKCDYIRDYENVTMKKQLNEKAINALKPKQHPYRVFDDGDSDTKGLLVQITPAGSKTWFLNFTVPGKKKRRFFKIGDAEAISLGEARNQARAARMLIGQSIDPIEHKAEQDAVHAAEKALGTVNDLFIVYLEQLKHDGKNAWHVQVKDISERHIVSNIGHHQANKVTQNDIRALLRPVSLKAKTTADHLRQALHAAFAYAIEHRNSEFRIERNPVTGIKSFRNLAQKTRSRALSIDEVRILINGMSQPWTSSVTRSNGRVQSQTFKTPDSICIGVMLQLYTGQRVMELLEAKWSEFDLDAGVWIIPGERRKSRHKTSEPHLVPLSPAVVSLLNELKSQNTGSQYLFSNRDQTGPMSRHSYRQAVNRVIKRLKMEPWQPRDLRRTFKTLAAQAKLDLEIRNRIQGHAFSDIGSRAYDRYDYWDEKTEAMARWSNWLTRQLDKSDNNVVALNVG